MNGLAVVAVAAAVVMVVVVVLGSLVVSVLAIGPKVHGFKPGRGR
jgi:uncharacterized protein HemY